MHPKFGKKTKKFGTVVPLRAERVNVEIYFLSSREELEYKRYGWDILIVVD